jgi:hypothetical protein
MIFSRRSFLTGVSAAALVVATPTLARLGDHGSAPNGGKSQGQSTNPNDSGDFPFLNMIKNTPFGWSADGSGTLPGGQDIPPYMVDAHGYPSQARIGNNGFSMFFTLPLSTSKRATARNPLVLTWEGRTTISISFVTIVSGSGTPKLNSSTGLWTGRLVFYPTNYQTDPRVGQLNSANGLAISIAANGIASGSYLNKLALYFSDFETAYLAGEIFNPQVKAQLQTANFGVYRFMDWLFTNVTNVTTWATRKSQNYFSWDAPEYRAALYGGITTSSGNEFSLTTVGGYSWTNPVQGNYTGGAPVDKQTMHLGFNAAITMAQNANVNSGNPNIPSGTLSITSWNPLTFSWPSLPLSNGDIVGITTGNIGGNQLAGIGPGTNYHVVKVSGDKFQISLTSGGSAVGTASRSGAVFVTRPPTLSINGTTAVPLKDVGGTPIIDQTQLPTGPAPRYFWGTIVYDADLNSWLLNGGGTGKFSQGIQNGVPIEVAFQLCKELGMHPYFTTPFLAMDPMTDYVTELATYVKANDPGWMIPRYENGNEVWNTSTPITNYAANKAFAHWRAGTSDYDNWYGKTLSTMGQAIAAVYGGTSGNLGTKCKVFAGGQYVQPQADPSNFPQARIQSTKYVAQVASPQSGYLKTAANPYVSTMLSADYIGPSDRGEAAELELAWQYCFTNAGNPTAQTANLNAYVNTMPSAGDPNTPGNSTSYYLGTIQWGQSQSPPINEMHGYEGGYSPDLVNVNSFRWNDQWNSPISAASRASSCVVALRTYVSQDGPRRGSGNPAQVGMLIAIQNVTTMPQLNTMVAGTATMTSGSSIIAATNTLVAGQGVMFQTGTTLPPGISPLKPYYVLAAGLSGSQFQISTSAGGSPLVIDPTNIYTGRWPGQVFDAGWFVTVVSGNNVTLQINSTSFTAFSGTNGTAYYLGSNWIINNFRIAALMLAPDMVTKTTVNYENFALVGGSFPSQYEFSGSGSVWPVIRDDIWGTQSQEFAAIAAWNH